MEEVLQKQFQRVHLNSQLAAAALPPPSQAKHLFIICTWKHVLCFHFEPRVQVLECAFWSFQAGECNSGLDVSCRLALWGGDPVLCLQAAGCVAMFKLTLPPAALTSAHFKPFHQQLLLLADFEFKTFEMMTGIFDTFVGLHVCLV